MLYRKGIENKVVDALSRRELEISAVLVVLPIWLVEVVKGYQSDAHAQELLRQCILSNDPSSSFMVRDGVILYKGRIWVGNSLRCSKRSYRQCRQALPGGTPEFMPHATGSGVCLLGQIWGKWW